MLTLLEELHTFKVFADLNDRELETIAGIARAEELGPGARLTEAGAAADRLYLVASGLVRISVRGPAGKEVTVDEVGPGDVVGWSTVTGPYVYTATAVTAERSRVIVLRGTKLREILEINNHIGYRVLKGIGNVVARRLTAIQARCAAH